MKVCIYTNNKFKTAFSHFQYVEKQFLSLDDFLRISFDLSFNFKVQNNEYIVSGNFKRDGDDELFCNATFVSLKPNDKDFLVNAYLNLIEGKFIESLDRIGIKEFDHYLRLDASIPSFPYYDAWHFEIAGIGDKLRRKFKGKVDENLFFDEKKYGPFHALPFGQKIEVLEELFSKTLYVKRPELVGRIEILDFEDETCVIESEFTDIDFGEVMAIIPNIEFKT